MSVVLPLPLLAQIEDRGFDWQVPGLRAELVTGLLRALPKAIRRHVVPAADWAEKFGRRWPTRVRRCTAASPRTLRKRSRGSCSRSRTRW